MATENITELSNLALADLIDCKSRQADAMMALCTGEGFETFSCMNEDAQQDYLWTVSELVHDVRRANDEVNNRRADEPVEPVVDMAQSGLQANAIEGALVALLQVIPEDQTDTIGYLKSILKLAHDLSSHVFSGGQYKYVLKEVLDEAKAA